MLVFRLLLITALALSQITPSFATPRVRIKDITSIEGVRGNQLVGYGLVVGLNGTGDTIGSTPFTRESLASMLERLGVNVRDNTGVASLNGKNVAAVMVTATLPPFARHGSKVDVNVSALGDAKDLRGGTLLVTPLLAADGQVYSVAQGPVSVGGFTAQGQATSVTKGVPTGGRIAGGAIVEKEVGFELASMTKMKLSLNNPDFTTAKRISDKINGAVGHISQAIDPTTITMHIPEVYKGRIVEFITTIEQLEIQPDQSAKIVIDDHDGIIVMGQNVRISPCAISHGSITIRIEERPEVSQPNPFVMANATSLNATTLPTINPQTLPGTTTPTTTNTLAATGTTQNNSTTTTNTLAANSALTNNTTTTTAANPTYTNTTQFNVQPGQQQLPTGVPGGLGVIAPGPGTAVVARTDVKVKEEKGKMAVLEDSATLQQLVDGLNALGATPRELITILQSIKASGALQGDIEVI